MPKLRVLIVDDAVVIRRLVSDVLTSDPEIEVAGIAANGRIALAKIPQINPDIVTLDIEMPEMDGLETLKELRKTYPRLPVIMFSTLTERGAVTTLEALSFGASDYVTKPSNVGSVGQGMQRVRDELIPKIKDLCRRASPPPIRAPVLKPVQPIAKLVLPVPSCSGIDVVAIGISTGGPNALAVVMPSIPADFPVPIVIVQHMPPLFTRLLAERLSAKSNIPVHEGVAGVILQPGTAYIAPGDFHMTTVRDGSTVKLATHKGPPENSCRPAVDVLFRSVAESYGSKTLGLVMTGMGADGLRGAQAIHEAGGRIFAQDEQTSVVWGMPGFVAQAELAEKILPLESIGPEIVRTVNAQKRGMAPLAGEIGGRGR